MLVRFARKRQVQSAPWKKAVWLASRMRVSALLATAEPPARSVIDSDSAAYAVLPLGLKQGNMRVRAQPRKLMPKAYY